MILTIFQTIKENVSAKDIADYYNLEKKGKLYKCPFHSDSTPSMMAQKRYYCFACNETGDAVDLVSQIYNLRPKEAAEKIVADFGLYVCNDYKARDRPAKKIKSLREIKLETISKLIEYKKILNTLKPIFAPLPEDETMSQAFLILIEKLREIDEVLYRLYQNPTEEEIRELIKNSEEIMEV